LKKFSKNLKKLADKQRERSLKKAKTDASKAQAQEKYEKILKDIETQLPLLKKENFLTALAKSG